MTSLIFEANLLYNFQVNNKIVIILFKLPSKYVKKHTDSISTEIQQMYFNLIVPIKRGSETCLQDSPTDPTILYTYKPMKMG